MFGIDIGLGIFISLIITLFTYAVRETLRDYFTNIMASISVRGEQLGRGNWVKVPSSKVEGLVLGNNFTNTKIDTGDGVSHILNEKMFGEDLTVIANEEIVLKKARVNKNNDWSEDAQEILEEFRKEKSE